MKAKIPLLPRNERADGSLQMKEIVMKSVFKTLLLASSLICCSVMAQERPRPVARPEIPPVPIENPQAPALQPMPYPTAAPQVPTPYFDVPVTPQVPLSNRCFVNPNSFGLLAQWAPVGTQCWVSDGVNAYNGIVQ
jgi:hypothetical protein